MPRGDEAEEWLAGYFSDGVPHGHVDGADRDGTFAVAAGLLVAHECRPDANRIEVVAGIIEQRFGRGFEQARGESLANEATLAIASIGVEAIADDTAAVADHIGDDRDQRAGHFGEVDVGVGDGGGNRRGDLAQFDDTHEAGPLGGFVRQFSGTKA